MVFVVKASVQLPLKMETGNETVLHCIAFNGLLNPSIIQKEKSNQGIKDVFYCLSAKYMYYKQAKIMARRYFCT